MTRVAALLTAAFVLGVVQQTAPEDHPGGKMMKIIETERLILRPFRPDDWPDVRDLAIDWKKAPGPEFDKLPTGENEVKALARHLAGNDRYFAVCQRQSNKVIGLIGLNGIDADKQLDLGHIILSTCQDNDLDREALAAIVDYVFTSRDVESIVTRNAPDHAEQLAPLHSLGFRRFDDEKKGELVLTKADWKRTARG